MKGAHRRAVDDAQQHAAAGLHLDHFGIGERAIVGQERVVFHVVQVRLGGAAHGHAGSHGPAGRPHSLHRPARRSSGAGHRRHVAALLELGGDLLGRREAEVGKHHDDFLLVPPVALIADDQRRRHQQLLLESLVRVHPEGAAETQREVVVRAAAWRDRRSRNAGHAVLLPRRREAVPVDQAGLVDPVFQAHAEPLIHPRPDAEGAVGLPDAEDGGGLAVHLDAAALDPQHRRRPLAGARARAPSARARIRARWPMLQRRTVGRRGGTAWSGLLLRRCHVARAERLRDYNLRVPA